MLGSTPRIIETKRLEQVVDSLHLVAIHRIFGISSGKNDKVSRRERLNEIHTIEVGHVDVTEDSIHILTIKEVARFYGTLELPDEFKRLDLLNKRGEP